MKKAKSKKRDVSRKLKTSTVVKPPKTTPRQPKLKNRKVRKPNGSAGDPILPEQPIDLGELKLPTPDASVEVLRGLAMQHESFTNADKAWKELKQKTKDAKEKRDEILDAIMREIKLQTHESSLPLLNLAEREADQARMEDAAHTETV